MQFRISSDVSVEHVLPDQGRERKRVKLSLPFCVLFAAAGIVTIMVGLSEGSLTAEQRIAAYQQSGMFP